MLKPAENYLRAWPRSRDQVAKHTRETDCSRLSGLPGGRGLGCRAAPQLDIAEPGSARFEAERQKAEPGCRHIGAGGSIHPNLRPTGAPARSQPPVPRRGADDMGAPSAALTSPAA